MSGIPVFSAGTSLQSSGASVSAQIPADSAGMLPLFVRVTATAAGYFRLSQDGASAAVGDLLVQPSDGLILKTCGLSQFSFVSQSGASTITVTPIDVGGVAYPSGITPPVNVFSPLSFFAAGEQGVYFDPNNSATLFEDAAGTIPTALERPVGAMLDLRDTAYSTYFDGAGDYLSTSRSTNVSGDFTVEFFVNAANVSTEQCLFGTTNTTSFDGVFIGPSGKVSLHRDGIPTDLYSTTSLSTNTWYHVVYSRTSNVERLWLNGVFQGKRTQSAAYFPLNSIAKNGYTGYPLYFTGFISNLRFVESSLYATDSNIEVPTAPLTAVAGTSLLTCGTTWSGNPTITAVGDSKVNSLNPFTRGIGNHATSSSTARPTLTRRVNQFVNSETLQTQSVTTRATTQTLRFEGTGTITLSGTATGVYTAGTYSVTTTAGTLTATVLGTVTRADLREANFGVGLPAYQRVGDTAVNAADYDTTGFPAWLRCSGGQSMVTPSINFTGTDKMTVWAGVRKLSDAAIGTILEVGDLGTITNGVSMTAPQAVATGNYGFQSGGSSLVSVAGAAYAAPISNVLAGIGDVSGPNATLRANGAQIATSSVSQGTGNYGNYPLHLFARNQASRFFNGLAGPIIVRGAKSSAAEISNAENWINAQQKVY